MTSPSTDTRAARIDRQRSLRIAATSAACLGGWALLANLAHGLRSGIVAALVQVGLSFSLSFLMAEGIHACERRLGTSAAALVVTAFGPGLVADAFIAVTHALAGTPEILRTMAPGIVSGAVSACLYVAWRARARGAVVPAAQGG